MASDEQRLADVEAAIDDRLSGKTVEEWSEAGQRMRVTSLTALFDLRDRLKQTSAGGATNFGLAAILPRT